MKTRLAIIRHGKAESDSPTGSDDDRRLTARGERQASYLGQTLSTHLRAPMVLISSPILRARQTARLIAEALGIDTTFDDRLATGRTVADALSVIDDALLAPEPASLLLVGHNPHFEALCWALARPDEPDDELKTGAAVILRLSRPLSKRSAHAVARLRLGDEP